MYFFSKVIFVILLSFIVSCSHSASISDFSSRQKDKQQEQTHYVQAELDFYAAYYSPVQDDMRDFRLSWSAHGGAFPESRSMKRIEDELSKEGVKKVVLVSLFTSEFEKADLKDKNQGWAVYPLPDTLEELTDQDVVLRTFMPIRNTWARYFLMTYKNDQVFTSTPFIVSNKTSKAEFQP